MKLIYTLLTLTAIEHCSSFVLRKNDIDFSLNLSDGFFSEEWRSLYDSDQLYSQPKWRLGENQPPNGHYQIRDYVNSQWADMTACVNVTKATNLRRGFHERLMWAHNQQELSLLYPIIFTVLNDTMDFHHVGLYPDELRACRYSLRFHYPVYGASSTLSMDIVYNSASTYYVLTYFGNYKAEYCDQKAKELQYLLVSHKRDFISDVWYCAQYEKGINETVVRYEVWLEKS